jgi:hypothetical protein
MCGSNSEPSFPVRRFKGTKQELAGKLAERVAELAKIPNRARDSFVHEVGSILFIALMEPEPEPSPEEVKISLTAAKLHRMIKSANLSYNDRDLRTVLNSLSKLSRAFAPNPKHKLARFVARDFVRCALEAGGHLTINKNDDSGTLMEAMQLVGPYINVDVHPTTDYQRDATEIRRSMKGKGKLSIR